MPQGFSWIDHRLVSVTGISKDAATRQESLYLFLVCVSDDKGLSYYGDQTLMTKLSMDTDTFENALVRSDPVRTHCLAKAALSGALP